MSEPQTPATQQANGAEHAGSGNTMIDVYGAHVRLLLDAVRRELPSIPTEISDRVAIPLQAALDQAVEAHSAIVARLESEAGPAWSVEPLELARYRESATPAVSKYLIETIRKIDAGANIGSIFVDRLQRLNQTTAEAPEEIRVPDEPGAYVPRPDDSALRRLHKAWLRLGRKLRARRKTAELERLVPLRQVLQAHVNERIANALLPVHENMQQAMARRYAGIEREITQWSFGVLDLDYEFGLEDLVTLHNDGSNPRSDGEVPENSHQSPTPDIERVIAAMERMVTGDTNTSFDLADAQIEQVLASVEAALLTDLQIAGTPLGQSALRPLARSGEPGDAVWKAHNERWTRWHAQVLNRLDINRAVLALREEMAHLATRILCETRDTAVLPVRAALQAAQGWLDAAHARLEDAFDAAAGEDTGNLVDTLDAIDREADVELQRLFQNTIVRDAQTALMDPGSARWKELVSRVSALPADLLVHSHRHERLSAVHPRRKPFAINLREIATGALAPDWPSLLSEAAEPLKARITRVLVGAEKLHNVIDYNLGAAIEELKEPSGRETARKLAADAFRRSGELVDDLRDSLDEPWSDFTRTFDLAVHDDWQDLISQVKSDDAMSERWTGLRTSALRGFERWRDRGELFWKEGLSQVRQRTKALRRLATRLLRRSRSAVGLVDTSGEDESTIADALRSAEDAHKDLPLVYRRLFTLGDVADPSMLQGRGRDLVTVRKRFEKWKSGGGGIGTLVLTASIGGGRTSFIDALQTKVFDDCLVWSLVLEERVTTSNALLEAISDVLDLPESARTWAGVEAHLCSSEAAATPIVFFIHNLEHVLLQTAGGTDLLQELLALMARTDHAVFWVSGISDEAWGYFEKVAALSAAVVGSHNLGTIGRQEVEEIVLGRHNRSGMTLQFLPPKEPSPLLKRRLRHARTTEREQEILQEIYFDGVFKHAGGGISLTLLYWLRSVEFEDNGDVVAVKPFQPISFDQLSRLDLPRLFALKAFVLHNTLTAAELAKILRAPIERGALILESLLRLAVIERTHSHGTAAQKPVDFKNDRFRLSRLVVFPVVERLRGARVLY